MIHPQYMDVISPYDVSHNWPPHKLSESRNWLYRAIYEGDRWGKSDILDKSLVLYVYFFSIWVEGAVHTYT